MYGHDPIKTHGWRKGTSHVEAVWRTAIGWRWTFICRLRKTRQESQAILLSECCSNVTGESQPTAAALSRWRDPTTWEAYSVPIMTVALWVVRSIAGTWWSTPSTSCWTIPPPPRLGGNEYMIYHDRHEVRLIVALLTPMFFVSGHTASKTPDPIRTRKLSCARPGQYWGGGPPGKPLGCCWLFFAICLSLSMFSAICFCDHLL